MYKVKMNGDVTQYNDVGDAHNFIINKCREGDIGNKCHYIIYCDENEISYEVQRGYYIKNDDKTVTRCK